MAFFNRAGACVVSAVLLLGTSAFAAMSTLKAQEARLKAQGRLELCLKKNSAKMLAGGTDQSAACQSKFSAVLTKTVNAGRYLDNGDGTVTDLNTGLQWEKKTGTVGSFVNCLITTCSNPQDVNNLYQWSLQNVIDTDPDGGAFTDFLAKLNNGASTDGGTTTPITGCFAGHCDWRLPTIVELQGILDLSVCGSSVFIPCIDPAFGPTQPESGGPYSSSTTVAGSPTDLWAVYFSAGPLDQAGKGNLYFVRAVRGGL
jgi:hypothetical protein